MDTRCIPNLIAAVTEIADSTQTAEAVLSQPETFGNWGLLAVALAYTAAMCKVAFKVWESDHRDLDRARLSLEQVSSAFFVSKVIAESKRVFEIVDDHLPLSLSQKNSPISHQSRFDHFCQSLREIPPEELDDRGKYSNIIKETFGRIISDAASRILSAMNPNESYHNSSVTNPTLARYSLEGGSYLDFAGIARFSSVNSKLMSRFKMAWVLCGVFAALGIICGFSTVLGILYQADWAQYALTIGMKCGLATAFLTLVLFSISYYAKQKIITRSHTYSTPESIATALSEKDK